MAFAGLSRRDERRALVGTLAGMLASSIIHGADAFCTPGQRPAVAVSAEVPVSRECIASGCHCYH